jgi:hypothetical protein
LPATVFFGAGAAFALAAADFVAELLATAAGFLVVTDLPVVVVFAFVAGFLAVVALEVAAFVAAVLVAVFVGRALVAGLGATFAGLFCSHYVNHYITWSKSKRCTDLLGGGGISNPCGLRR